MKISLCMFGQYRTFKLNLENNLINLKDNILKNNIIDIYILTDKKESGNYSIKNEKIIIDLFNKYNCNIEKIYYWEDLSDYYNSDIRNKIQYDNNIRHTKGADKFTSNLWYRKYLLNKLKNEYCELNNKSYDCHMFIRLFDTQITLSKSNDYIIKNLENYLNNNYLLFSGDLIHIGKKDTIDKMFEFGKEFCLVHDDIWYDLEFSNYVKIVDTQLFIEKPTYCSEIQTYYYIFKNIDKYLWIRTCDRFNTPSNENSFFYVKHCPHR